MTQGLGLYDSWLGRPFLANLFNLFLGKKLQKGPVFPPSEGLITVSEKKT